MQIKLFTIPVFEEDKLVEEMNRFLRSKRILDIHQKFFSTQHGGYWCFSIRYLDNDSNSFSRSKNKNNRVDYKAILEDNAFQVFSLLRTCRKEIAKEDAVPAFAVFTDAELANIAQTPNNKY